MSRRETVVSGNNRDHGNNANDMDGDSGHNANDVGGNLTQNIFASQNGNRHHHTDLPHHILYALHYMLEYS
ncbi:7786_t:CDS:2 [Gigaspora rosea]|nr:7786_t:CDS:2 [Gigaspora rosea]